MSLTLGCRKVHYSSRAEAVVSIRKMVLTGLDSNPSLPLRPYVCDQCKAWHIGHDGFRAPDSDLPD